MMKQASVPFWRDERVLAWIAQIVFLVVTVAFLWYLYHNMITALAERGLLPSFHFLKLTAGFDISQHLIPYDRSSTYGRAFIVGTLNTIEVSILGIIFATILGIIIGVMRLSTNWLINKLASLYIEIIRNVPLLVLLVFWYTGVFLQLPRLKEAKFLPGPTIVSNRGIAMPWGKPTSTWHIYLYILLVGFILAAIVWWRLTLIGKRTGRMPLVSLWSTLTFLGVAALGWIGLVIFAHQAPLAPDLPKIQGLSTVGGLELSPEFLALLSGLVFYTAAFIAEVVRAGIQSVSKGQVEAARALGLNGFQTFRLVVFPQALRVIVPPLTSQYLNLAKNSSLAVFIGFPDLYSVAGTIHNQTGRAVEVTVLMMSIYLSFSLITSAFMNWYNKKIRFVER